MSDIQEEVHNILAQEVYIRKIENGYTVEYFKKGVGYKECSFSSWRATENFIMQHFGEHLKKEKENE